jgi:hypothetical protein
LKGFATSLRHDLGAMHAALDLPWTTSPVEGQIIRLRMLKRTMYSRAGFQLLCRHVLSAAYGTNAPRLRESQNWSGDDTHPSSRLHASTNCQYTRRRPWRPVP